MKKLKLHKKKYQGETLLAAREKLNLILETYSKVKWSLGYL